MTIITTTTGLRVIFFPLAAGPHPRRVSSLMPRGRPLGMAAGACVSAPFFLRQREDVQRVAALRMLDVRTDRARDVARAAAAKAGCDRDVLTAADGEGDGRALHGGAEPRLPQRLPGLHVERAERAIEIADEADAARRRHDRRQERRALLARPDLLHRLRVVGGELPDVAVAARHFEEAPVGAGAAGAVLELDLPSPHLHARLAERNDQEVGRRVITHRLPVVAALGARTRLHPALGVLLDDVGPILRHAGLRIDRLEHVLKDRFGVAEELAASAIDLPEDARLADREEHLLIAFVHEHALEYFVEIE